MKDVNVRKKLQQTKLRQRNQKANYVLGEQQQQGGRQSD